jgi:hypothetical protein
MKGLVITEISECTKKTSNIWNSIMICARRRKLFRILKRKVLTRVELMVSLVIIREITNMSMEMFLGNLKKQKSIQMHYIQIAMKMNGSWKIL